MVSLDSINASRPEQPVDESPPKKPRCEDSGADVKKWGTDECSVGYDSMTSTHHQHEFIYQYSAFLAVDDLVGKKVLDIPSGEGKYTVRAFRAGAAQILSVDIAPKMIDLTRHRVEEAGFSGRWRGLVANATAEVELPEGEFDIVMANYLFEYAANEADLAMMARNLFRAAKPNARLSVLYVPGFHPAEDIGPVKEASGIECMLLKPNTKPGTSVELKYHNMGGFSYEVFYWPVELVMKALEGAGFSGVEVHKLRLDPAYRGTQDLEKFAKHTGNRSITGWKAKAL